MGVPLDQQEAAVEAAGDGGKKTDTAAAPATAMPGAVTNDVEVPSLDDSNESPSAGTSEQHQPPSDMWETQQLLNRCADRHFK